MQLTNDFVLDRPLADVWAFFHDIGAVAGCLPGAAWLGSDESGAHKGTMAMKVGPFQVKFEGLAQVAFDEAQKSIQMEGQGVDKKGGSRGKMVMACRLQDQGASTRVSVETTIQMSGAIAQFGRSGIVEEIAKVMIADFVANAQAAMSVTEVSPEAASAHMTPAATPAHASLAKASSLSASSLMWRAIRGWFSTLFGRKAHR